MQKEETTHSWLININIRDRQNTVGRDKQQLLTENIYCYTKRKKRSWL